MRGIQILLHRIRGLAHRHECLLGFFRKNSPIIASFTNHQLGFARGARMDDVDEGINTVSKAANAESNTAREGNGTGSIVSIHHC